MNRSTLKVVVVAVLAAVAILAVAGSVDDATTAGGGAAGPAGGEPTATETTTVPTTTGNGETSDRQGVSPNERQCQPQSVNPLVGVGIAGLVTALVVGVYRRHGRMEAVALAIVLLFVVFLGISMLSVCQQPGEGLPENRSGQTPDDLNRTQNGNDDGAGAGGEDGPTTPDLPLALVAIVAVLAAAGAGAVLVTREDDDEDPFDALEGSEGDADSEDAADVDAFAAAAGRAADRIEDGDDVDNEIYRAWVEMTRVLDVEHPASSTPGEFRDAAVDAGVDRSDVVELTDLFERVRYGTTAPTAEREKRALDALRRIETQYGEDSAVGDDEDATVDDEDSETADGGSRGGDAR